MVLGSIEVWARPGSHEDRIAWDDWRHRWVVACRESPTGGRANEAILRLLAERLGVPRGRVRFEGGGRSRSKRVEVEGVPEPEIARRLRAAPFTRD